MQLKALVRHQLAFLCVFFRCHTNPNRGRQMWIGFTLGLICFFLNSWAQPEVTLSEFVDFFATQDEFGYLLLSSSCLWGMAMVTVIGIDFVIFKTDWMPEHQRCFFPTDALGRSAWIGQLWSCLRWFLRCPFSETKENSTKWYETSLCIWDSD